MDKLYIVMPAYNEEENIQQVISQWHPIVEKIGQESKLIIVNDGSKDNTYAKLLELQSNFPQLVPINKENSGHGSTCLYAYNYAIENNADYIFQTDSDGQTNPDEFWPFWEKRHQYDFIIGSRKGRQDGFSRVIVTKTLKLIQTFLFKEYIEDSNTPFRLLKTDKLIPILAQIPKDYFLANVLMSVLIVKRKEKALWIPISFKPRQGGINSINMKRIRKIGYQAIKDFYRINKEIKH